MKKSSLLKILGLAGMFGANAFNDNDFPTVGESIDHRVKTPMTKAQKKRRAASMRAKKARRAQRRAG